MKVRAARSANFVQADLNKKGRGGRLQLCKFTSLLVAFIFMISLFTGCGTPKNSDTTGTQAATTQTTQVQTTQATEPPVTTLKVFLRERWAGVNYDNFATHYIEEKTHTKWDVTIGVGEIEEKLNVLLASGYRPDILQYSSDAMEMKFVQSDMLYPLNKSFDKSPNLQKWGGGGIWEAMTYPNGNIYSLPIKGDPAIDFMPIYRKDWLDKLGLQVPKTIDEYYAAAVAMVNNDPDGNGKKDTYAIGANGAKDLRYLDHIFGAFGVLPPMWQEVNGHLESGSVQPGTKEALKFLNKLYAAGAIDPEFITDDDSRIKSKFMKGLYGATTYKIYLFDSSNLYNYYKPFHDANPNAQLVSGPVLTGGSDKPLGMRVLSQRGWVKTSILKESKNIDAAVGLLDWLASEEGQMFVNYGVEGQDYTNENGVIKVTINDEQMQQRGITECYLAMNFLVKQCSPEFQEMVDYSKTITTPDVADGILVDELKSFESLEAYRATEFAKMIVGDVPVDTGFDNFVSEWNKQGGEALTKAIDAVYQQRKSAN